ncbi:DEHA2E17182p [Debaryomyces hansenii CBS767]|jgi:hypothetical protein|uniref:DEHA2E17182p n=1 Tax=Debaryomyces hansenii (strain ATCC 36239 / CBS 767 / BCRC 21394 / JCM 1990 / NBRC 0083 / IGC 2968) TaxID=284592 RepID=Q6BP21_DEBHA|nr:DEHA2E17182p [Debaryomyces hansenii CBS767]CAG88307.1 DEHA2E17182p [Debaryomyces hansenii CBS767]|eukprot:XP_460049.1 DEHA2E17182p [Debaryomyces hansenii CBS767]
MTELNIPIQQDLGETDSDYLTDSDSYYYDDSGSEYELTAQEQWEESLKQINNLINLIIFPLIGKVIGRRFSHIIWRRFANWWFV